MFEPVLIDGEWQPAEAVGSFSAVNPSTGETLPDVFPVSGMADVEAALDAGQQAAIELRETPIEAIADFLDSFGEGLLENRDALVVLAATETGLPAEPRLNSVELPRTANQLHQAAASVRERSWVHATIDTAARIRSSFRPLGKPVAVFGPNNFPFAFNSVSGGDFAAAIAAGNPVIGKAHTSHPSTTKLLAEIAKTAADAAELPRAMVQLIYRLRHEDGAALAGHAKLGAIGFTGGRRGGLSLKGPADAAGIPIYLEMSSVNPVFILQGALEERGDEIASEFAGSCTLGAGQFCTNPGLLIVPKGDEGDAFVAASVSMFAERDTGTLLSDPGHIEAAVDTLVAAGADVLVGGSVVEGDAFRFANTILTVSADEFVGDPDTFQTEAFGPVSLIVRASDTAEMAAIAGVLEGNLTGGIYSASNGADDDAYVLIEPELRPHVGRLLNDKMPTGVAVSPAMNHGGPFPSTGHPGFTAVGIPGAIHRFAALHSYDNVADRRLPPELQDENPTGELQRYIDLRWTTDDVR
ncbi:MAG: aldehyde dehydrogenase (NADP(+)) [Acidimicrobiia bacterium]